MNIPQGYDNEGNITVRFPNDINITFQDEYDE